MNFAALVDGVVSLLGGVAALLDGLAALADELCCTPIWLLEDEWSGFFVIGQEHMKFLLYHIILIVALAAAVLPLNAQKADFNAGIIAGLNFSELEGEGITDYFGLNVGLFASAMLSDKSQLVAELLFSQNGEYVPPETYPDIEYGDVWLNHVEMPVHFDRIIPFRKDNKQQELTVQLGLAYARLVSHNAENKDQEDVSGQLLYDSKDALLQQYGMLYKFNRHWGLNLRASLPIRKNNLDWTLAARLIYSLQ